MSRKARNRPTNVSVSVLSRTGKQQIDYFVVKPRKVMRWDLMKRSLRQSAKAKRLKS